MRSSPSDTTLLAPDGSLPELSRIAFVQELRVATGNLREVARVARTLEPRRVAVEQALGEAWSNVALIEKLVGLPGTLGLAATARRFIVVDDSADMRFLVRRTLRSIAPDARIDVAADGAEALALLRDAEDGEGVVVITDHEMGPGVTGVELLAEIAVRHPRSHRVIFSGHPPEMFEGREVAAHAVLSKDASKNALRTYFGVP